MGIGVEEKQGGKQKTLRNITNQKTDLSLVRRNTLIQKVTPVCPFYCSHYLDRK